MSSSHPDRCRCREADCAACPARVICRCLNVTEEMILDLIAVHGLLSATEIRQRTGAGTGCMACRHRLHHFVERVRVSLTTVEVPA